MKVTKILVAGEDVYLECPHCEHWESQPVDSPRHHLQTFNIVKWEPTNPTENDLSIMSCHVCKEEFKLDWDYENLDNEEQENQ